MRFDTYRPTDKETSQLVLSDPITIEEATLGSSQNHAEVFAVGGESHTSLGEEVAESEADRPIAFLYVADGQRSHPFSGNRIFHYLGVEAVLRQSGADGSLEPAVASRDPNNNSFLLAVLDLCAHKLMNLQIDHPHHAPSPDSLCQSSEIATSITQLPKYDGVITADNSCIMRRRGQKTFGGTATYRLEKQLRRRHYFRPWSGLPLDVCRLTVVQGAHIFRSVLCVPAQPLEETWERPFI
uniref:Uncharacterized protein n=1 Tax=Steinernema glaseri TaxID=37863 RepID=A0A1I7ZUI6_9BILA